MPIQTRTRKEYTPDDCEDCTLLDFNLVNPRIEGNIARVDIYSISGGCNDCLPEFSLYGVYPWVNYEVMPSTPDGIGRTYTLPFPADTIANYDFILNGRCVANPQETENTKPFTLVDQTQKYELRINNTAQGNARVLVQGSDYGPGKTTVQIPGNSDIVVGSGAQPITINFFRGATLVFAQSNVTGNVTLNNIFPETYILNIS